MKLQRAGPNSESYLTNGRYRKLTNSEINRGYLFISKAKYRSFFLDDEDFTIIINGHKFPHRHLDNFGRAIIHRPFMRQFKSGTNIKVKLVARDKVIVKTLN